MGTKIILGKIYQYLDGDKVLSFRVIRYQNKDTIVCKSLQTGEIFKKPVSDLDSTKYVWLRHDALLNLFYITNEAGELEDVAAIVNKLDTNEFKPAIIVRQDVYSQTKNSLELSSDIYVGECIDYTMYNLNDWIPQGIVKEHKVIALYVNDKWDDIKMLLDNNGKYYNNLLEEIKSTHTAPNVVGYCSTLSELFEDNDFMVHYRIIFNIGTIPFSIILSNNSNVTDDGEILLNDKQLRFLEEYINKKITDVTVIRYDKDIDIGKIVSRTHMMISDATDEIFLVCYTIVGELPIDVDDDIARAMGL